MRMVGWVTISLSIAIPIVLWVASLGLSELNSARSAWTGLGADFYFLPFIVSIIGLIWMWALESAQDRLTRRAGRTSVLPVEGALTHCLIQR